MAEIYQIRVKEHLDDRWANRFEGFTLFHQEDGTTLLSGPVPDQAALHGLLMKVRDLGLTLLAVVRTEPERNGSVGTDKRQGRICSLDQCV